MSKSNNLFYFIAGAASAGLLSFLSHLRSAHNVRRNASRMATIERLDGRAEIPPLRPLPEGLTPLEDARRELASHQSGSLTVLLVGPPSTGKTQAIRSYVAHAGVPALFVRVHSLLAQDPQYTSARFKDLAARASAVAPAIVVLDGIDEATGETLQELTREILQLPQRLLFVGVAQQEIPVFARHLRL
jgi:hypothetical protein